MPQVNSQVSYIDSVDRTWYHLTDPLVSTVAVIDNAAKLIERISFDPYGKARHHYRADIDGDGDVETGPDLNAIRAIADGANRLIGQSNYNADIDRDGDVDTTDYTLANAEGTHAGLAQGLISDPAIDNIIGYAGYLFNPESPAGTYTVRHRHYDPTLGRFISRDPIGYADGMSLYEYAMGSPAVYVDPLGLMSSEEIIAQQALADRNVLAGVRRGEIDGRYASTLINRNRANAEAQIRSLRWQRELGKGTAGTKAVVNASASTVASFATVNRVKSVELWGVTEHERAVGYDKSMIVARASTELGFGVATGAVSHLGRVGKAIMLLDAAGNVVMVGEGAIDAINCGLSLGNATQIVGGAVGLGGNVAGAAKVAQAARPPSKVAAVGNQLADWLGPGAIVKRSDAKGIVIQSQDGLRQFRMDLAGHGKYQPHAHLEVRNSPADKFIDAPGTPHHVYFNNPMEAAAP